MQKLMTATAAAGKRLLQGVSEKQFASATVLGESWGSDAAWMERRSSWVVKHLAATPARGEAVWLSAQFQLMTHVMITEARDSYTMTDAGEFADLLRSAIKVAGMEERFLNQVCNAQFRSERVQHLDLVNLAVAHWSLQTGERQQVVDKYLESYGIVSVKYARDGHVNEESFDEEMESESAAVLECRFWMGQIS
jgi:hypothetical protein